MRVAGAGVRQVRIRATTIISGDALAGVGARAWRCRDLTLKIHWIALAGALVYAVVMIPAVTKQSRRPAPAVELPAARPPVKALPTLPVASAAITPASTWSSSASEESECSGDCSGHRAGYRWAERRDVTDADDCRGNSRAFKEGCQEFAHERQGEN